MLHPARRPNPGGFQPFSLKKNKKEKHLCKLMELFRKKARLLITLLAGHSAAWAPPFSRRMPRAKSPTTSSSILKAIFLASICSPRK